MSQKLVYLNRQALVNHFVGKLWYLLANIRKQFDTSPKRNYTPAQTIPMAHIVERISDNKVKLTVTIPAQALTEATKHAAEHMAQEMKIPGFRPGKAPYEVVKQHVGEMALLEHAAEELIRETFVEAMIAENLETVGQPYFSMEKLAPDNDLVYSAEISLMPSVKKLADFRKLTVARGEVEPTDAMLEEAKTDLLKMRMKEVRAEAGRALTKGDKAIVALGMKKDGVTIEGGESQNHGVYTNEAHYIPGFVDEIIGMKEGEAKTFTLKFPDEHYQKHIAGSDVEFAVTMNEIYTTELPAFDDAFAVSVGLKSADEVMEKLRENLRTENAMEEGRRLDKAVLDLLAEKSTFEEIPDLLVNQEIDKMLRELEQHITSQGMDFNEYLSQVGKTVANLKLDFAAQALMRVKVAIALREVQKQENVKVDEADVDAELDKIAATFKEGDDARKRVYEPVYREYVERQLLNRKTIEMLKETMVK